MPFVINHLMKAWVRARISGRAPLIMPTDEPRFVVDGPDPIQILLIVGGPAAGVGVRSHALGLTGELARSLAVLVDRGIDVRAVGRADLELNQMPPLAAQTELHQFDALVVIAGAMEVVTLLPVAEWQHELQAVVARLRGWMRADAGIVLVGIPRITSIGSGSGWWGRLADQRAVLFNEVTRQLAAHEANVTYVRLPSPIDHVAMPTNEWYRRMAAELARALLPRITG